MFLSAIFLCVALAQGEPVQRPVQDTRVFDRIVSVDTGDVSLEGAIRMVMEAAGVKYRIDPAAESIARQLHRRVKFTDAALAHILRFLLIGHPAGGPLSFQLEGDTIVFAEPKITLELQDATLETAMRLLFRHCGSGYVCDVTECGPETVTASIPTGSITSIFHSLLRLYPASGAYNLQYKGGCYVAFPVRKNNVPWANRNEISDLYGRNRSDCIEAICACAGLDYTFAVDGRMTGAVYERYGDKGVFLGAMLAVMEYGPERFNCQIGKDYVVFNPAVYTGGELSIRSSPASKSRVRK